jgi:hypothetical protein
MVVLDTDDCRQQDDTSHSFLISEIYGGHVLEIASLAFLALHARVRRAV